MYFKDCVGRTPTRLQVDLMQNLVNNSLLAGVGLLLLSLVVPFIFGERRQWTDSQAVRFQEASHNYHAAIHAAAHGPEPTQSELTALDQARSEYERHAAMLVTAQTRGHNLARTLRWLGILLCALGCAARAAQRLELFGKTSVE
jgi:hypothetical protein